MGKRIPVLPSIAHSRLISGGWCKRGPRVDDTICPAGTPGPEVEMFRPIPDRRPRWVMERFSLYGEPGSDDLHPISNIHSMKWIQRPKGLEKALPK